MASRRRVRAFAAILLLANVVALVAACDDDGPPNTDPRRGVVKLDRGGKYCDGANLVYTQYADGTNIKSVTKNDPQCAPDKPTPTPKSKVRR